MPIVTAKNASFLSVIDTFTGSRKRIYSHAVVSDKIQWDEDDFSAKIVAGRTWDFDLKTSPVIFEGKNSDCWKFIAFLATLDGVETKDHVDFWHPDLGYYMTASVVVDAISASDIGWLQQATSPMEFMRRWHKFLLFAKNGEGLPFTETEARRNDLAKELGLETPEILLAFATSNFKHRNDFNVFESLFVTPEMRTDFAKVYSKQLVTLWGETTGNRLVIANFDNGIVDQDLYPYDSQKA